MIPAQVLLWILAIYFGMGCCFAVAFMARGAKALDHAAIATSLMVRLAWFPGAAALWPILLLKWSRRKENPS